MALGVGVVLAFAERYAPSRWKPYIPSASGIGIAMVVPGANSIAMFLGAAIAELVRRRDKALAERGVVAAASGFIAGESLMGIAIAILVATGVLGK